MNHLEDQLHLPDVYSWYDAQSNRNLLDVDVEDEKSGFKKTLNGTTDAVVAKTQHVRNNAVRNHVAAPLELKRPDNKGTHEPQVCLEHLAASVLNPNVPVLTGLSDLNQRWTFYWFGSSDDVDMGVAIKKLELVKYPEKEKVAKYLLESFAEESNLNRALPETFVDRLSWKKLRKQLKKSDSGSTHTTAEGDHAVDSGDSPGQEDPSGGGGRKGRDGTGRSRDNQGSSGEIEQNKKQMVEPSTDDLVESLRLLCPLGDVANVMDLLDTVDEDDRVRSVREVLAIHVVPRITGEDPRNLWTDHAEESDAPSFLSAANLAQHDQSAQIRRRCVLQQCDQASSTRSA